MAVYKVPQDVEADDKLIGPFSFRQFIYLVIVAVAGFIAFMLSKIFIGLIIIPLPIIIFFGALALPLRKDQPMETYLVAVVRFLIKPRVRMWSPEGAVSMVTITAPRQIEQHLTKDFGGEEAAQRLSYLAQVVDTQGWATRGVLHANDAMNDIFVAEAQTTTDVLDESAPVSRSFDQLITQQDAQRRQQAIQSIQQPQAQVLAPPAVQPPVAPIAPDDTPIDTSDIDFNPYPSAMHQRVITPSQPAAPQRPIAPPIPQPEIREVVKPIPSQPSPDILRLANTKDLSISALAHEAHRLTDQTDDEVVIALR